MTRKLLPLSHRREDTFIAGISMGGYGALINGLRYSDTFSKIGMLSPRWACIPRTERCSPEARFTGSPCWRCWEIRSTITGRTAIMRLRCARPLKNPQDMPRLFFGLRNGRSAGVSGGTRFRTPHAGGGRAHDLL